MKWLEPVAWVGTKKHPLKKDKIIGIFTTTTNLSNTVKKYFFKHSNFNYR